MDKFIKQEPDNLVFNLDNNTQLEFLNRKTIIVIDKDRFVVLKQLMLENAPDEDFARFLNVPLERVRYFKHKMQLFEDSIRARRRAARLNAQRRKKTKPVMRKREISSEERFKRARELIGKNFSTNQISKILKISERSVTRFKKRIREEKRRLKAEGKIYVAPDDPDDESSFKYLSIRDKIKRAKELFRKRLKIHEISEILKISERSVRRWKDRLMKMDNEPESLKVEEEEKVVTRQDTVSDDETEESKPKRKRKTYLDREKVQYAKELIQNGLSNKEMSMLLEMSIACVRKLKLKILNGTSEELIDDSEEHYSKVNNQRDDEEAQENNDDPLNLLEEISSVSVSPPIKYGYERKPKVILGDREMLIVTLLRQNEVRTMDIAKMLSISERSVTRLLSKSKSRENTVMEYSSDIVEEVDRLLATKDEILNSNIDKEVVIPANDESKLNIGMNLLAMNVKTKDIAKMLDVTEKTVQKWKIKMIKQEIKDETEEQDAISLKNENAAEGTSYSQESFKDVETKEEYIVEYLD